IETAPGSELPPCVLGDAEVAGGVLRLSEGVVKASDGSRESTYVRIPLCEGCGAAHVCPGAARGIAAEVATLGTAVAPGAPGIPPTRERARVLQELRSVLYGTGPSGQVEEHRVVRVNFHCNQACDFCFVSRELPAPEEALLEAELADVARRGASLALSGGEP